MEQKWDFKSSDGAAIYGVKNSVAAADAAIFMVHGLMCNMYEYAFKRAADYFERDYDVYRFNLYDGRDGARCLNDCSLTTHANDLIDVLNSFSREYKKVFLIGHSYGGTAVMLANIKGVTAVSLWDPSYDLTRTQKAFSKKHVEERDLYSLNRGISQLLGKGMFEQAGSLTQEACEALSSEFQSPVQVLSAENAMCAKDKDSFHSYCAHPSVREVIKGADHYFREGNSCDILLEKTEEWFRRFL
ncbi:MAG: hypothetical protein GC136_10780 [Alphaproteobacteria bacterium]|nr:hypothetical protein [Alphaproteobacteria bacterium]